MPRQKQNKKIIIGVTGSFGSGKSAVAGVFASYGAKVIDADKIARACLKRGSKIYREIVLGFGPGVITKNKEIDRRRLSAIVFNDKRLLAKLEAIVHPEVIRIIRAKIRSLKKGVIILDAPLLLEAGLGGMVNKLIVVTATRDAQLARLLKKTYLKKTDILKRLKFQISQKVKSRFADFIIDNSGSLNDTRKQVANIRRKLWKS